VEYRYSSTLSLTSALDGVGGQRHAPAALPLGKTRYPLHRRFGGPQGRSGRVRKISPPPTGFDRQTAYPVASPYTDWAIQTHERKISKSSLILNHAIWYLYCLKTSILLCLRNIVCNSWSERRDQIVYSQWTLRRHLSSKALSLISVFSARHVRYFPSSSMTGTKLSTLTLWFPSSKCCNKGAGYFCKSRAIMILPIFQYRLFYAGILHHFSTKPSDVFWIITVQFKAVYLDKV
jgi:hypothetical protein